MNFKCEPMRERELRGLQLKITLEIQFAASALNKAHAK